MVSAESWRPAENVTNHAGQPLVGDREFFQPPPPEIGDVISAWSTLRAGSSAWPLWIKICLLLSLAALTYIGAVALGQQLGWRHESPIIFGIAMALVVLLVGYLAGRFQ